MKKRLSHLSLVLFLIISVCFIACTSQPPVNSIVGLWQVERVQMGDQEMTPVARWTRFNSDETQASGNGWLQHSIGSWELMGDQLYVVNKNGIMDTFDPFQVKLDGDSMTWQRKEDGNTVHVFLKKIEKLPMSKGNDLVGLWKLKGYKENGKDVTKKINVPERAMIHFRWDNVYVQHNMPQGKRSGVYKIHGHKPEIQMIKYGKDNAFDFWKFDIVGTTLTMTSLDNTTEISFERSYQFPQ